MWRFFAGGLLLFAACSDGDPPRAPGVVAENFGAAPVSPTPSLRVTFSDVLDPASTVEQVLLVRGEPDAALERPPPPASEQDRLVAAKLEVDGADLTVTPRHVLDPESHFTLVLGPKLVVGGAQLGRPIALAFDTGALDDAAPILSLAAPLDGAVDVPRNLRAVEARWSRPVSAPDDVTLVDDAGVAVAALINADGVSVRFTLTEALAAERGYQVRAGPNAIDSAGRAAFGDPPGFMTGDEIREGIVAPRGIDVRSSDRCAVMRFTTDVPAWSQSCIADHCASDGPSVTHEAALAIADLLDGRMLGYDVVAWDETTRPAGEETGPATAPPSLLLALTEILPKPLGPKLSQQFVELYNAGTQPIDLGSLTLHTAAGGNALSSVSLAAGEYAVVVPIGFVAGAGGDAAPAASALLVRVADAHLGGRGIKEAGEPVWIEDATGSVVTRWGGYPIALVAGQSVSRPVPDSCDVTGNFVATPSGSATPGGP